MNIEKLIDIASFTPKSLAYPNGWIGHLPFAAWLIKELKPEIFVELGTHSGNSYFSFCQAVQEGKLSTRCYAVDTWKGDEHAGSYDDDVFVQVNTINSNHYSNFSKLLRATFDEAAENFSNESIGLLHIDGLHTYEAVRHDFETWLPKLKSGAVVVFHDTNVRERNFGVWKYWEELQRQYPNNLEFPHSNGLGVLQLESKNDISILDCLKLHFEEKIDFIKFFSALGTHQITRFELLELKQKNIIDLQNQIYQRNSQIENLQELINAKNSHALDLENKIKLYLQELSAIKASKLWKALQIIIH